MGRGRPKKMAQAQALEYIGAEVEKSPAASKSSPALAFLRLAPDWVDSAFGKLKGKRVIITFHSLGDLDACCSALALAEELGTQAVVAPPDRTNSESRRILGDAIKKCPLFCEAKAKYPNAPIIVLDANDRSILPQFKPGAESPVSMLIDHHAAQTGSLKARTAWMDPDASSTCELAAHLIESPSCEQAERLIYGLLSDSARLTRADAETFAMLSKLLLHAGARYEEMLAKLEAPESTESRAAVLEGLRQVTWNEEGGLLIALAAVSSHESHVADVLMRAGADAAFVGSVQGEKEGKNGAHGGRAEGSGPAGGRSMGVGASASSPMGDARISARLRPSLASKVDLPSLMQEVGKSLGGSGGGHPAAAGATGPRGEKLSEVLQACPKMIILQTKKKIAQIRLF